MGGFASHVKKPVYSEKGVKLVARKEKSSGRKNARVKESEKNSSQENEWGLVVLSPDESVRGPNLDKQS